MRESERDRKDINRKVIHMQNTYKMSYWTLSYSMKNLKKTNYQKYFIQQWMILVQKHIELSMKFYTFLLSLILLVLTLCAYPLFNLHIIYLLNKPLNFWMPCILIHLISYKITKLYFFLIIYVDFAVSK